MDRKSSISQLDLLLLGRRGITSRISSVERTVRELTLAHGAEGTADDRLVRPNLLLNSSFEFYNRNAVHPNDWTAGGTVALAFGVLGADGSTVISCAPGGYVTQQVAGGLAQPKSTVVLSAAARSNSYGARVLLEITHGPGVAQGPIYRIDSDGNEVQTTEVPGDGKWYRFWRPALVNGGAVVIVQVGSAGSSTANLFLDAVKYEKEDDITSFIEPSAFVGGDWGASVHLRNLSADNITAGTLVVGGSSSTNPRISVRNGSNLEIVSIGDPTGGYYGIEVKEAAGIRVAGSGSVEVVGGGDVILDNGSNLLVLSGGYISVTGGSVNVSGTGGINIAGGGSLNVTGGGNVVVDGGLVNVVGSGAIRAGTSGAQRIDITAAGVAGYNGANQEQIRISSTDGRMRVLGPGAVSVEGGGSLIAGTPGASRVELNSGGIYAYNALNEQTVGLSTANGTLTIDADALNVDGTAIFDAITVQGAVTILQNLTLGANVLFVNVPGQRVGINRAPDPQFDLDIAGSIRWGGYGVGKMALQLTEATGIFHFDGKLEQGNLTGTLESHLGQAPVSAAGAVFVPGRFNKGLHATNAVTNIAGADPSFETGVDGWTSPWGDAVTSSTERALFGTRSLRIAGDSTTAIAGVLKDITVTANTTYTISAYVYVPAGRAMRIIAFDGAAWAPALGSSANSTVTGSWERLSVTVTPTTTTMRVVIVDDLSGALGFTYYIDGVQVEARTTPTPFTIGSRPECGVRYSAAQLLTTGAGTVAAWVKPEAHIAGGTYFVCFHQSGSSRVHLYVSGGVLRAALGDTVFTTTTALPNGWSHVALTWDGTVGRLFLNGVEIFSGNYTGLSSIDGHFRIGSSSTTGQAFEGIIDDVVILSRAANPTEVRAIYESNAPVFAETSTWGFRTSNTLAWADEEGLWARDASGNEAFAVVGVNGKSWGNIGQNLDAGDVLIGNTTSYALWDASAATLNIRGSINASTITGSTVRTAPSGARVEMNTAGLWVVDEASAAAFGVSAVNNESWGGFTLDVGDLLIGNSSGNYLRWDDSAGSLTMRGNIVAGDISGVNISSSNISAGGGAVQLNADGLRIVVSNVVESRRSYGFYDATNFIGGLSSHQNINNQTLTLRNEGFLSNKNAYINLQTDTYSGGESIIWLIADRAGATNIASVKVINTSFSRVVEFEADKIITNGKNTLQAVDTWLRINNSGDYSSGTYTPHNFRTDGYLYIGPTYHWLADSTNDGLRTSHNVIIGKGLSIGIGRNSLQGQVFIDGPNNGYYFHDRTAGNLHGFYSDNGEIYVWSQGNGELIKIRADGTGTSIGGNTYQNQRLRVRSTGNTSAHFPFTVADTNENYLLAIRGDNQFWMTGTWTVTSDGRLKRDIQDLDNEVVERARRVSLKKFHYTKHDDGRTHLGVIAQELQTEFPELVVEITPPATEENPNPEPELGVNYTELGVVAFKLAQHADKELREARQQLRDRIDALEARVVALESKVT